MKVLKRGMRHPQVVTLRDWLKEACFDPGVPPFDQDLFDGVVESKVKLYQRAHQLDDDGIVGNQETWPALEQEHFLYVTRQSQLKREGLPERPTHVLGLQDALDKLCSGKVGYGTPTDNRSKMLKRPVELRLMAELFDEDERQEALAKHGTTNTFGGCGSFADRVLEGCILQDTTHRAFANQTAVKPPRALRDPRFADVNDNTPAAMIEGDKTWQASGWKPTCRGYASRFEHMGPLEWSELEAHMEGIFFALLHLRGGHMITAFYSDHERGWWYTHPLTGDLLPDNTTFIFAADGWSGNVGQKTTLQRAKDRLGKKPIDHLWALVRPGSESVSNPAFTVTFEILPG